jgi:hypothetical protein
MFFNERKRIVDFAEKQRLPAMYFTREFVQLGGLVACGTSASGCLVRPIDIGAASPRQSWTA